MKKFFTLAAAVGMVFAANAKQNLDLPSPWGPSCVLEGTTYTFDGSWAGAGLWLGTEVDGVQSWYDASASDYAFIAYSNHTGGDVAFGVCYNKFEKEESWGAVYTTVSKKADMPEGIVAIKLDKTNASDNGLTCAQEIRQLQLQDQGTACSITIDEIGFITEEEYLAIMAGQGSTIKIKDFALPGEGGVINMTEGENNAGWYSSSWIGMENIADEGYKALVIEVASAEAPFQILAQNWPDGEQRVQAFEATTEPITVVYNIGTGADELSGLGQFAFQNLNVTDHWMDPASGEEVSWYDANKVVVTRAYLTSGKPGEEPGQADANVLYDGGETLSWGAVNISGDKLIGLTAPVQLAITVQSTTGGWWQMKFCDNSWQSLNLGGAEFMNATSVEGFPWNTEDFTFTVTLDAEQLAKAQNGMIAQGSGGDDGGSIILKKVALVEGSASVSAIEAAPVAGVRYNMAGQHTNATSGLMIQGGRIILVK